MTKQRSSQRHRPTTFVLVHGAWAGGWSWLRVAERLTARGHRVFAPALSGLGERSHLAHLDINLSTHVDDVVNEIRWKDLDAIVLVGHSYGGIVITGVVERVCERIASMVYVDAFIPADGQAFIDFAPDLTVNGRVVPPPPTSKGDYFRASDRAWVDSKATPQPTATFTERLRVTGAYQLVPKKIFVRATGWAGPFATVAARARADPGWTVFELPCGHDVAIDMPDELAAILEGCA